MIYIFILVLLFLFSFTKGKLNDKLFIFGILLLLIVTCLRNPQIGIDTKGGYYLNYTYAEQGIRLTWIEWGFELVNRMCVFFGLGYQGVIAISGILTIIPVSFVIYKSSVNKCLVLSVYYAMYYVLFSYNMMRQMIAVSFALLSMYFFNHNKKCKALLFLIIGFLFHKSIIVILPLILLKRFSAKYSVSVVAVSISLILGILLKKEFFYLIVGSYSNYLDDIGGYNGFRTSLVMPVLMALAFSMLFLFITYFNYSKLSRNKWYWVSLIGVMVMNLTVRLGQGTRIVLYFSQAQMMFLPEHIKTIDKKTNRIIIKSVYYTYLLLNFFRILLSQWDSLTPYRFF